MKRFFKISISLIYNFPFVKMITDMGTITLGLLAVEFAHLTPYWNLGYGMIYSTT
jgi:hypothetical protein